MGSGWENRAIAQNLKVEKHRGSLYPRHRSLRGWWEYLSRTTSGRFVFLVAALLTVWLSTAAFGHFVLGAWPDFGEALWQSTTHLIEPGSIDYDDTVAERTIGLIQVIAGLIFLAGIVLTVLTEMVQRAMSRFGGSDPAISRSGHLLVIGFNPTLEEVRHRLCHYADGEIPETVVFLPNSLAEHRDEARGALRATAGKGIVLVADIEGDGLTRVCAGEAQRIVVLSPVGDPEEADLEVTGWAGLIADHLAPLGDDAPPVGLEIRRHRNVQALWFADREVGGRRRSGSGTRFPASFDALVRDRIIGGTLSLAITNPDFADTFLDSSASGGLALRLQGAGRHAGTSFGEARSALEPTTLLGVMSGTGPTAKADYLPDENRAILPDERLIVIPRSPGHSSAGRPAVDPAEIKVSPSRPGPVLMIGFSDASRAIIEDLADSGYDGSRIHLLNSETPAECPAVVNGSKPVFITGSPIEPEDLGRALDQVEPAIVFVAAPEGHEAAAVISGMMADQRSQAPIIVEQYSSSRARNVRGTLDCLTVVSTAGLVAENIATSSIDPALLVATQTLFDDPALNIESLAYATRRPLPIDGLGAAFAAVGSVPIAIALGGESGDPDELQPGDHILVLQRTDSA